MLHFVLSISLLLHIISAYYFYKRKTGVAVFVLFIANLLLRYWCAGLDPFLNDWDEKFHALVAKNLTHHWLKPTLTDIPLLPCNYKDWFGNYIWLHKQPLFLWQIALSIKLFGANVFAVRLPSIILGALLVLIIFDLASTCFNRDTGYIAAFLFSFYEPALGMSGGYENMDHNTMSFMFYITLSLWAWIKFEKSKKPGWAICMGLFAGCAILTKWLTGLLVFGGFGFYHLFLVRDFFSKEILVPLLYATIACILVALPWQLYTLYQYPLEARYELYYNNLHLSQVIEGHSGERWFYFDHLKYQYKMLQSLIFIGFAFCLLEYKRYKLPASLIFICTVVYIFFTVAVTKIDEYVLIVSPLLIIFMAFAIYKIWRILSGTWFDYKKPMLLSMGICSWLFFDYNATINSHSSQATGWILSYREGKTRETQNLIKDRAFLKQNDVIIDCPGFENIDVMFFTNHIAYRYPDSVQKQQLISQKMHLVEFSSL
jgi:4-amino-4-deoxy-L-arabinose transferase